MAANAKEFADKLDVWLRNFRDKESNGELIEAEMIHAVEALKNVARPITGLGARIDSLEKGPQAGRGEEKADDGAQGRSEPREVG